MGGEIGPKEGGRYRADSNGRATPLWVIGSFVGVSEVVAGVTVINTEGAVQAGSLAFMAVFTTGVAAAFFFTLWKRSEVFFPPDQYRGVNMREFVELVGSGRAPRERRVVEEVTKEVTHQLELQADQISKDEAHLLEEILDHVEKNFIEVKFNRHDFGNKPNQETHFSLFSAGWGSVSEFLNEVYFQAHDSGIWLPAFEYGTYWALRNVRTGELIGKQYTSDNIDTRPFEALQVTAGDVLEAVRLNKPMMAS